MERLASPEKSSERAAAGEARQGKKPGTLRRIVKACLLLLGCVVAVSVMQVAVLRVLNPPFTGAMVSNWVADKVAGREAQWPDPEWRPLRRISPT